MNETEKRAFAALNAYYTSHDEDARFDSRHNSVEFLTTLDYIGRYLAPGDRIAEIGAGSGRYSHALARQGYHVDAVELIPRNIALFRERTKPGEDVVIREGTATDLSCFADGMFGMTLLLGPMYHLFTEEEQRRALREAVRITKPGGHVFVSYCMNEGTVVRFGFLGLELHRIFARCDDKNAASYRVMERIGMRREGHFIKDMYSRVFGRESWRSHYLYAILQKEYLAALPDGDYSPEG